MATSDGTSRAGRAQRARRRSKCHLTLRAKQAHRAAPHPTRTCTATLPSASSSRTKSGCVALAHAAVASETTGPATATAAFVCKHFVSATFALAGDCRRSSEVTSASFEAHDGLKAGSSIRMLQPSMGRIFYSTNFYSNKKNGTPKGSELAHTDKNLRRSFRAWHSLTYPTAKHSSAVSIVRLARRLRSCSCARKPCR